MADLSINVRQANADFQAIKNKIIESGVEVAEGTRTAEYAEKVGEVYEVAYNEGMSASGAFEAGKKAQEREWWDNYQAYGNRTDFDEAFGGIGWTVETFKPKYDMIPTSACMMFRKAKTRIDLVEHLNKLGVKLDFSKCTNTIYAFNFSEFTRIGVFDCSSSASSIPLSNVFTSCSYLVTIDKIVLKKGSGGMFENTSFKDCISLENVTFEGVIDVNGLNLQWSTKLSKASWQSIIGRYAVDLTLSMTGSKASVDKAFETSEGANDGSTSAEWLNLLATRPNLTVNLI